MHKVETRSCKDGWTRYFCSCGQVFEDPQDAAEHVEDMNETEACYEADAN